MHTISQMLVWGKKRLSCLDHPVLESEVLLCAVLHCDRTWIKAHSEYDLSDDQKMLFESYLEQRAKNVPVAYILGYKDWGDMRLEVNSDVLIPRDETEILCRYILDDLKARECANMRILDIGTGSGAIACFMARNLQQSAVTALDISENVLSVAEKNAQKLQLSIKFVQSDLLTVIDEKTFFNVIIANLPYVSEDLVISKEVQKEPALALFSGMDGMDHYRRLVSQIEDKQIEFDVLWIEFLPQQEALVEQVFSGYEVRFFTDSGSDVFFAKIT